MQTITGMVEQFTSRVLVMCHCNFTDNTADYGGAVYFGCAGNVTNCS